MVSAQLKSELLALKKEDLTVDFLVSKIATTTKATKDPRTGKRGFIRQKPQWDLQDTMILNPGEYINIKKEETTVGIFLVNKLLFEGTVADILDGHYVNETMTNKTFGGIMDRISIALMEDKIPLNPNVVKFIQAFEFYGLMLCSAVSPSFTPAIFTVQDEVRKERDAMFAKCNGKPNLSEAVKIEDSLVKMAKDRLKGDPGMDLFDSGARGNFDDNYKMMSIMVGPVRNPSTGKYDIVKSALTDGVHKDELTAMANTVVNAAYPRAVGTAEGGYITKQYYAVYQSIQVGEAGSDCGSKGYLPVFLTSSNFKSYTWQYIVGKDGSLTLLTNENAPKYFNQLIYLRSPIGCLSPKICNKCIGERFFKLGVENVGLTTGRLPNSIMNTSLKAFHNTKVHFSKVDPDKLLID